MSEADRKSHPRIYGALASFDRPEDLVKAAEIARQAGFRRMDAYTPFPVHHLAEALGRGKTRLPWIILGGALFGALCGIGLQYYTSVVTYPINVGNRPYAAWPSFMVVTFELTILGGA